MIRFLTPERVDAARSAANILFAAVQPLVGQAARVTGGGRPIEERSFATQNPVTPVAPAFAIWGPIFAANLHHAVRAAGRGNHPIVRRTGWLTAAAYAGDAAWELWTQYRNIGWKSVGIIVATATTANAAMLAAARADEAEPSRALVLGSVAPLAGWLTVATAANIASARIAEGGATDPVTQTRAAVPIVAGTAAAASAISHASGGNLLYAGAAGWGLAGVAARNVIDRNRPVLLASLAGLAAVAGATLVARRRA